MSLTFSGGPDYIDTQQQDQTTIYTNAALTTTLQQIAQFNCSQLSHILVNAISQAVAGTGFYQLLVQFSVDNTFTNIVATNYYVFRDNQMAYQQFIPMFSNYCRLTWQFLTGVNNGSWNITIAADTKGDNVANWNRGRSLSSAFLTVPGGATINTQLTPTAGGPASLWYRWGGTAYTLTGLAFNDAGTQYEFFQFTNTAPANAKPVSMNWPKGPTVLQTISGDGAQWNMVLSVVMA